MENEFIPIQVTVNGVSHHMYLEDRRSLLDMLRDDLGLTGTHAGCEQGSCGACTVLVDGKSVRSCLMFAVQTNNHEVTTVESLAKDGKMHPLQEAFWEQQGLQCGFCTPGFLMTACELLQENPHPSDEEIREALSGNICRCTGYQHIVNAVRSAADALSQAAAQPSDSVV